MSRLNPSAKPFFFSTASSSFQFPTIESGVNQSHQSDIKKSANDGTRTTVCGLANPRLDHWTIGTNQLDTGTERAQIFALQEKNKIELEQIVPESHNGNELYVSNESNQVKWSDSFQEEIHSKDLLVLSDSVVLEGSDVGNAPIAPLKSMLWSFRNVKEFNPVIAVVQNDVTLVAEQNLLIRNDESNSSKSNIVPSSLDEFDDADAELQKLVGESQDLNQYEGNGNENIPIDGVNEDQYLGKQSYSTDFLLSMRFKAPGYLDVALTQEQEQINWINQQEQRKNFADLPMKGSRRSDAYQNEKTLDRIAGRRDLMYQQDLHLARRDVITYNRSFLMQFKNIGTMALPGNLEHLLKRSAEVKIDEPKDAAEPFTMLGLTLIATAKKKKNKADLPVYDDRALFSAEKRAVSSKSVCNDRMTTPNHLQLKSQPSTSSSRTKLKADANQDEKTLAERKIRSILNKLAPEHFDDLILQASQIVISKVETLRSIVEIIFEKSISESVFAEMYAHFCSEICTFFPELPDGVSTVVCKSCVFFLIQNFNSLLTQKCFLNVVNETDREKLLSAKARATPLIKSANQLLSPPTFRLSNEVGTPGPFSLKLSEKIAPPQNVALENQSEQSTREEAVQEELKFRKRTIGTLILMGELYKRRLLPEAVMFICISQALDDLSSPDEHDIEALCQLLTTAGAVLDSPKNLAALDLVFEKLQFLAKQSRPNSSPLIVPVRNNLPFRILKISLSTRVRFLIESLIELRSNGWVPRRAKEIDPKKLSELKQETEQLRRSNHSEPLVGRMFSSETKFSRSISSRGDVKSTLANKNAQIFASIDTQGNRSEVNTNVKKAYSKLSGSLVRSQSSQSGTVAQVDSISLLRSVSDASDISCKTKLFTPIKNASQEQVQLIPKSLDREFPLIDEIVCDPRIANNALRSKVEKECVSIFSELFDSLNIKEAIECFKAKKYLGTNNMIAVIFKGIFLAFNSNKQKNVDLVFNLFETLFCNSLVLSAQFVAAIVEIGTMLEDFDLNLKIITNYFADFVARMIAFDLIPFSALPVILNDDNVTYLSKPILKSFVTLKIENSKESDHLFDKNRFSLLLEDCDGMNTLHVDELFINTLFL